MSSDDADRWVILELNSRAEGEDPDLVSHSIQNALRGAEVFVPAVVTQVGDDRVVHYLVDGYAFLRRAEFQVSTILRLENSRYVNAVLTESTSGPGRRKLSTVPSSDIERMRGQISVEVDQGICIGDKVSIISGHYRNIEATVVEEIPEFDQVQVFVKLRSKQSIVTLPRSFLKVMERSPLSSALSRLTSLGAWTRTAKPVFDWTPEQWPRIQGLWSEIRKLETWQARGARLAAVTSFVQGGLTRQLKGLETQLREVRKLEAWISQARPLFTFVSSFRDHGPQQRLTALTAKLAELQWFNSLFDRIDRLRHDVNDLAHQTAQRRNGGQMLVQNVLVDGLNLAFRCLYAPGMADLKDKEGRPTGMVLGFLQSLGSLKKRFPDARIYVAWDGTSRRRKQIFGDYKANRPTRSFVAGPLPEWSPLQFLQEFLPLIGVRQVFNPEEEADDVIATLVRGELNDQHNLIFSTDRDLLQLVSVTTRMLMPGAGTRKETLFDLEGVKTGFGVDPGVFLQLRAFYGDPSDNIPGVPRVPKKVLRSLVQAYGSVEGVYKSGLSGLTKGQYERLRSSEPQVRINLTLMTLSSVKVTAIDIATNPDTAVEQLRGLNINPDPIIHALFGRKSEPPDP